MDFHERLQKAIQRGKQLGDAEAQARAEAAISEEECRRLHSQYRLQISDHIEQCLKELPRHFPGFRFESMVGDRGWGGALVRDDLTVRDRRRENLFSRLEVVVRPFSSSHVIEVAAKGTIHNKEIFNRSQYQRLGSVDVTNFCEQIDRWVLEYAEMFASRS